MNAPERPPQPPPIPPISGTMIIVPMPWARLIALAVLALGVANLALGAALLLHLFSGCR
jgi:hypothetical protein